MNLLKHTISTEYDSALQSTNYSVITWLFWETSKIIMVKLFKFNKILKAIKINSIVFTKKQDNKHGNIWENNNMIIAGQNKY